MAARPEHPFGNTTAVTTTDTYAAILTLPDWDMHNLIVTCDDARVILRFGTGTASEPTLNDDSVLATAVNGVGVTNLNIQAGTVIYVKSAIAGEVATNVFLSLWQDR